MSECTIEYNCCTFDIITYSYTVSTNILHMPLVLTVYTYVIIVLKVLWHLTGDSSVVNDPLGKPGHDPLYAGLFRLRGALWTVTGWFCPVSWESPLNWNS